MSRLNLVNCNFIWKVMKFSNKIYPIRDTLLFNVSPNTGLYSQVAAARRYSYITQVLSPEATYYQVIRNIVRKELGIDIKEKKPPYELFIPSINKTISCSLKIRFFWPSIVTSTIKLSCFLISLSDLVRLAAPENFERNFRPISDIVKWTIGLAESQSHRDLKSSKDLIYRPAIYLDGVSSEEEFQSHFDGNRSQYVGLVIRSRHFDLDKELIDNILEKNRPHNRKSLREKLLIDKQGILYVTSASTKRRELGLSVFGGSYELYEIASVFRELLAKYFWIRTQNEDLADFMLFVIRMWVERPEIVFVKSVNYRFIWKLLIKEFELKSQLEALTENIDGNVLASKFRYFSQSPFEWWNTDKLAQTLSGEIDVLLKTKPSEKIPDLGNERRPNQKARRRRVFISYSHADEEWLKRLQIHIKPFQKKGVVDSWDDTKIKPGMLWRDEIKEALSSAKVAVLLVSADFLASDFIIDNELPPLLSAARKEGVVILPVILKPCAFSDSELEAFQSVNPPSQPLSGMSEHDQELIFVKIAKSIKDALNKGGKGSNPK